MRWDDTQVLVTGGLGFIGSNLAHELVNRGAEVHLLDARLSEYGSNPANVAGIRDEVRITEADVRDRSGVESPVQSSDVVFHLAAQLSRTVSNEQPATDASINCEGFLNVLKAAESAESSPRVVFTSSQAVVGSPPSLPFDEETPAAPLDVYGANKCAGEHYCRIFDRSRDVPALSVRLTNVYGPRAQLSNPNYGVIHNFIASALRDGSLTVFEPGTMERDFIHVSDIVDGLLYLGQDHDHYGE
jgi:UDP-glucose 4-epimerase